MMMRTLGRLAFTLLGVAAAAAPFCAGLPALAAGSPPMPPVQLVTPHPLPPSAAMPIGNRGNTGLPAPDALHYSSSAAVCKAKGASDIDCSSIENNGALVFYTTWNCSGLCTIDGFKLKYAAAKFNPSMVRQLAGGSDALDVSNGRALFVEKPPAGGWKGKCYVVTAFHNPTRRLISDGSGGMRPDPSATASGAYAESPPSPQVCITATTRSVALPIASQRSYERTYSILYSNNVQKITDGPNLTSGPLSLGWQFLAQSQFSQTNIFHRAAVEFDRSSLGDETVFGGSFAYDVTSGKPDCARLSSPAPAGWGSAVWIKPTGSTVTSPATRSGSTYSTNVDAFTRGWPTSKRLTFFLDSRESAEFDQSGLENPAWSCRGYVNNVRLVLNISITQ
jgi:hypothetical protein